MSTRLFLLKGGRGKSDYKQKRRRHETKAEGSRVREKMLYGSIENGGRS